MNTRKLRWLSIGDCVINLDRVNAFHQTDDNITVSFANGSMAILTNTTLDDIRHYLKYGKPKRR